MHEHKFKRLHRIGQWIQHDVSLLTAPDEWINFCECGEERKSKTPLKGFWSKASTINIERIKSYPERWQIKLRFLLKKRIERNDDLVLTSDRLQKAMMIDWSELTSLLDSLVRDGIIEKFEPFPKRRGSNLTIVFRHQILRSIKNILGLDIRDNFIERISQFYDELEYPTVILNGTGAKVASIQDKMKSRWYETGKTIIPIKDNQETCITSLQNYLLLIETLRGIFNLVTLGGTMSFRELSVNITGDSKGLEGIKSHLRAILGDIGHYGIREHSPLIFCRLPVIGKIGDRTIDLSACDDYVSLTLSTAKFFRPVSSAMRRILLVENLTPFEKFSKDADFPYDVGLIFLSGYPPRYLKEFVNVLTKFTPVEALIWCDLDPDGVEIALTAAEWFKIGWRPIFMEKEFLLTSKTKSLTVSDISKLGTLTAREDAGIFKPLLLEMQKHNLKVEQEAQAVSSKDIMKYFQ